MCTCIFDDHSIIITKLEMRTNMSFVLAHFKWFHFKIQAQSIAIAIMCSSISVLPVSVHALVVVGVSVFKSAAPEHKFTLHCIQYQLHHTTSFHIIKCNLTLHFIYVRRLLLCDFFIHCDISSQFWHHE